MFIKIIILQYNILRYYYMEMTSRAINVMKISKRSFSSILTLRPLLDKPKHYFARYESSFPNIVSYHGNFDNVMRISISKRIHCEF